MLGNIEAWPGLMTGAAAVIAAVGGGAWWAERRRPKEAPNTSDKLTEVLRDEFQKTREHHDNRAREHRDLLIEIKTRLDVQGRS